MVKRELTKEQIFEALTAWMVIAIVRLPDGLEQIETAYAGALSAFLSDDATKCEDEFHKSGIDLN